MIYCIYHPATGQIQSIYTGDSIELQDTGGLDYVAIDIDDAVISGSTHYIQDAQVLSKPPKPSEYHHFDYTLKQWVINDEAIAQAKTQKKRQITQQADRRHDAPIQYDGKRLDADATARENIGGKINQLQAEAALNIPGAGLFWRDADNVLHTWASASVYLDWLQGLVITIANRRANLYAISWQAKAQIDALTDIQMIVVFDVNGAF